MDSLNVCIVGGIFGRSEEHQSKRLFTPETVLATGLRERGITVETCGHRQFRPTNDYDVVHVHHLGKAALGMATAATRSLFVYSSHDPRLVSKYDISRTRMLATKFVLNRADAAVALSTTELRGMRQLFGHYNAATVAIYNGFPSDVFHYTDRPAQRIGPYKLLFVGQLIELKGVDILLKALRIVRESNDAEVMLVYQNPRLEAHYKELVSQLGLEDRVHFLGFKSAFELAELYRQSDVFVLPTFAEALPSVVSEAMMSGLPVVASRVAGIPEQVGPHGRLVTPGNVSELVEAINLTLEDLKADILQPHVVSAYATAAFSISTMVEKHLRLYKDLLRGARIPIRGRKAYWPVNTMTRIFLTAYGDRLVGKGWLSR
ncbi:MAG: glycosyltransferase family 4 protein [Thermomicrobiales bacterium]